jgi:hypothetical protein
MSSVDDPFKYERGPEVESAVEAAERLEKSMEYVRAQAEPLVQKLAEDLQLSQGDVIRLAIVLFGRYLDMTRASDTVVLVVKGDVAAYDNAVQVLVSAEPGGEAFEALLAHLEKRVPRNSR